MKRVEHVLGVKIQKGVHTNLSDDRVIRGGDLVVDAIVNAEGVRSFQTYLLLLGDVVDTQRTTQPSERKGGV